MRDGKLVVRRCTFAEIEFAPMLPALMDEYGAESAMPELGVQTPQFATYRQLEEIGTAHCIGAFRDDDLIGFTILLVGVLPHFGKRIASTESFFVAQAERKSGAGLRLLHAAEREALSLGAVGLLVSAPVGGKLEKVMPNAGYRAASTVFFRGLPCAQT